MVRFRLPSHLFALLPEEERCRSARATSLNPGRWEELVQEIRQRFPLLGKRVLTESGSIETGFAFVVNDEILPTGPMSVDLQSGDEIAIIAAIAGG